MARAPRIRQSVAAGQQDLSATLYVIRKFIEDLHDGITLSLEIAGKAIPVKLVINPKDDAKQ